MRLVNKPIFFAVLQLFSLPLIFSDASAQAIFASPGCLTGYYVGIFGGGGNSSNNHFTQDGTVFFDPIDGGPLNVHGRGKTNHHTVWIAGVHMGYEWSGWMCDNRCMLWAMPTIELEGYYLNNTQKGRATSPSFRIPEHTFSDNFPMNNGVILINVGFKFNDPLMNVHPYLSGGAGLGIISISGATSKQIHPVEFGINHFNADRSATKAVFAAQAKAGVSIDITAHWRVFGEYRYIYLAASNYNFGPTRYATHFPTTKWRVHINRMNNSLGVAGIEYAI